MTLSITTLSKNDNQHNIKLNVKVSTMTEPCNGDCCLCCVSEIFSVVMLNAVMLSVVMVSVMAPA